MANKPSHRAFVVSEPRNEGDKGFWTEVGVIWPHAKGEGFNLEIVGQLSVAGRIVCMPIKDEADRPAPQAQRAPRREPGGRN